MITSMNSIISDPEWTSLELSVDGLDTKETNHLLTCVASPGIPDTGLQYLRLTDWANFPDETSVEHMYLDRLFAYSYNLNALYMEDNTVPSYVQEDLDSFAMRLIQSSSSLSDVTFSNNQALNDANQTKNVLNALMNSASVATITIVELQGADFDQDVACQNLALFVDLSRSMTNFDISHQVGSDHIRLVIDYASAAGVKDGTITVEDRTDSSIVRYTMMTDRTEVITTLQQ